MLYRMFRKTTVVKQLRARVDWKPLPSLLGSGDWQVAVLRVVLLECN